MASTHGDEEIGIPALLQPDATVIIDPVSGSQRYAEDEAPGLVTARREGPWQWLKRMAKLLKREVLAINYAMEDPRTSFVAKILPAIVLCYALSPIDLIPDFIPVLGILDDLILLPLLLWLAIKVIPADVMVDARLRAEVEPLRLDRNWGTATVIFLLWMACLLYLVYLGCRRWGNAAVNEWLWVGLAGLFVVGAIAFGVWMVTIVRKDRRKRAKAAAAAAAGRGEVGGDDTVDLEQPLIPAATHA